MIILYKYFGESSREFKERFLFSIRGKEPNQQRLIPKQIFKNQGIKFNLTRF
jgi:hypothetical protein